MVLLGSEYTILRKGEKAPDFSLTATNGKQYSLKDFKDKKAILVIFMLRLNMSGPAQTLL